MKCLVSVVNAWTVRNLVGSSLLAHLNRQELYQLTVVTTSGLVDEVAQLFPGKELIVLSDSFTKLRSGIRRNFWYRVAENIHLHRFMARMSTWEAKKKLIRGYRPDWPERLLQNETVGQLAEQRVFAYAAQKFAAWATAETKELAGRTFDLGLSFCINSITEDFIVTNVMTQNCTRSVAYMLSWDNPSSKNYWVPKVDEVLIWGDEMRKDMQLLTGDYLHNAQFIDVGALQFDWHFLPAEPLSEFPVQAPFVFYACVTHTQFADEAWFLEKCIIAAAESHPEVNWYIRVHPKEDGERFQSLTRFPSVYLDIPNQGDANNWSVDATEKERLRYAIQRSLLVCTSFGTLALEALIYGKKPVLITSRNRDGSLTNSCNHLEYHHTVVLLKKTKYTQVLDELAMMEAIATAKQATAQEEYTYVYGDFFVNRPDRLASDAMVEVIRGTGQKHCS